MASSRVQDQRLFGAYFAAATGLSPQIVGKWLAAEQGPGSSATPGSNNWLNIQYTDSGPNSTYFHIAHLDPRRAALASAQWLKEQSGLRGIVASAGKGVAAEARAIENSGWASSHYNGGLAAVPGYQLPRVSDSAARTAGVGQSAPGAQTVPGQLSVSDGSSASLAPLLQQLLAKVQQPQPQAAPIGVAPRPSFAAGPTLPEGSRRVQGLAPTQAPADESAAKLVQAALGAAQAGEPHITSTGPQQLPPSADESGHYVNPLPGFTKGRTDQGVDYSARPGSPILAIGNGKVLGISANWFEGQPYVAYQLHDGPRAGQVIYVAEQIVPHVRPGQQVRAGQRIGVYAPTGTGIETGFGSHTLGRVLTPYNGAADGTETSGGKQARGFLEHLGAR